MLVSTIVTLSLTTVSTALLLIYFYIKYHIYTYWSRNGIWQYPSTVPFGLAWPLLWDRQHMGDFFKQLYLQMCAERRTVAGFYLLSKPQLMITDPEDIKHILATDFSHFRDRGIWCDEEIDPLSGSLLSLPGDRWKRIRSKLSPFFTPNRMKTIFPTMESCGSTLIEVTGEYSDQNECFDMRDLIWRFTSTVLGSCVFGYECNTMRDPNDEVKLVGKDIFEPTKFAAMKRPFFFLMPNILKYLRISSNSKFVTDFFMNLVHRTIDYRTKNNVNRNDFMQILVDLRQKDNDKDSKTSNDGLTVNEIAAQCWVFFAGGFETAATLVTFCLFELSRNKEVQDKLREEVLQVLKKHDGKFTYESINDLKYTEKVIKETLRKYPPLPFLNRACTKAYTLPNSNVCLREGDAVVISVYGIQRDPEYYPDPEKFDPDRFNEGVHINPYTYLPFGEGPRNCIGLRMGMIQGKYTIALLISKFMFTFNEKTQLPLKLAKNTFTISVEGGIWLNAKRI